MKLFLGLENGKGTEKLPVPLAAFTLNLSSIDRSAAPPVGTAIVGMLNFSKLVLLPCTSGVDEETVSPFFGIRFVSIGSTLNSQPILKCTEYRKT